MFRLEDIQGLEALKSEVMTMVHNDHFPHATLFLGNEGNEKLHFAYVVARILMCENRETEGLCNVCNSCKKSMTFTHPDILFSFPFVKSGTGDFQADDFLMDWKKTFKANPYMNVYEWSQAQDAGGKQPNINAFECLQITRKLQMKPFESDRKVLLLWMPEYLGKESNRLLKILEEPPADTYIILVAEDTERLLPTIMSRCQLFKIKEMDQEGVKTVLTSFFHKNNEEAQMASYLANGNMIEALSLFNENNLEKNDIFVEWLRLCYSFQHIEIIKWVDHFATYTREVQKYILKFGIHFVKEMIKIKYNFGKNEINLPEKMVDIASKLCPLLSFESIEELIQILDREIYLTERNCNAKMQLMYTSGHIHRLFQGKRFLA
ncbi:hypothetical protein [Candidatus Brachybacter algidus]|uniref:DNA polymerase III subunit n=2 Tax=Candidatus Brachybacter algidus TaxID=2982024 RepID=UPI001DF11ABA|nr:hypothetical protein [Candidatus Brachybacter algidus]MBK6371670.1 hypothetical protein [Candidatus Brachybacter algidus]MBK6448962.1 hypothetical protein [Candidatus Brachybacter algidus]